MVISGGAEYCFCVMAEEDRGTAPAQILCETEGGHTSTNRTVHVSSMSKPGIAAAIMWERRHLLCLDSATYGATYLR